MTTHKEARESKRAKLLGILRGTEHMVLSAQTIYAAAVSDWQRREKNMAKHKRGERAFHSYQFGTRQVKRSTNAADLLRRMVQWREKTGGYKVVEMPPERNEPGMPPRYQVVPADAKVSVARLTANLDNLRLAYVLAQEAEKTHPTRTATLEDLINELD